MDAAFPLTLTLAPGEREQQFTSLSILNDAGSVSSLEEFQIKCWRMLRRFCQTDWRMLKGIRLTINGRTIPDTSTALNAIAEVPPGKSVPVKVIRRNQEVTLDVLVGKRRPRPRVEP